MMTTRKQQTMTKQNNYYFWLGPDGELDVVTEEQFKRLQQQQQEKRKGDRPSGPREN